MKDIYERLLAAASLRSTDGAVRIVSEYEPLAGVGTPLFPPTVKAKETNSAGYLVEPRYVHGDETRVVLLDQPQSQANRCETALLDAVRRREVFIPYLEMVTESYGMPVRMTSLEAPHRSRDAYFRDSVDESGRKFDETELGAALRDASSGDLSAYLRLVPSDLAYGVWDSHRKRRIQVKIPRAYRSEMIGIKPLIGVRAAGRVDRLNLAGDTVELTDSGWSPSALEKPKKGVKTARMSELGHGMIPPSEGLGGVSVTSVQRSASLSLAQLATLRFGNASEDLTAAARALIASIALLGDRLAFSAPALHLRSGCDLLMVSERIEWVQRGRDGDPHLEPLDLATPQGALELFTIAVDRAREAGLQWASEPVVVRPNTSLQQAIDKSYLIAGVGAAESE
ncbi:type I-U CRISPR-associated RAMP protein Csb1/Cas7u [Streptomyces spectabilis]|uniref:Type I-U CRISPR-associated protein Cas7 n=1 Tax=Streptomyces spectabilis TaxID=68270 RepID=A0A516REV1_STRST|nr:type I-U CRISPR-associated RAMP protein Csb1/Cas7u [Streptomyces spectabilis]QDQ14175.1 type I-U CRISPR-associated protein Cas7 [Streptomyces spectabilis]